MAGTHVNAQLPNLTECFVAGRTVVAMDFLMHDVFVTAAIGATTESTTAELAREDLRREKLGIIEILRLNNKPGNY